MEGGDRVVGFGAEAVGVCLGGGAGGGGFLAEGVVFVVGGCCSGGGEEFADVAVGVVEVVVGDCCFACCGFAIEEAADAAGALEGVA